MMKDSLHKLRQEKGISVLKLAVATGIAPSTLYKIESGFIKSPSIEHAQKLATALGVSILELINTDENSIQQNEPGTA